MNSIPKNFWNSLAGLVGALILLVLVMIVGGIKVIANIGSPRQAAPSTISVDGTGDALAVPDVATFSFSVTETAKAVADAQTAATAKVNAAIDALKSQGVADQDVSTESYTIEPHYEYQNAMCPYVKTAAPVDSGASMGMSVGAPTIAPEPATVAPAIASPIYCPSGKNVLTGYDVSETIQVKVRDLTKAGAIFASIGSLGVQNVNGLDFSVDDPTAVQAAARQKAIADAQSKAQTLAQQLGVSLGSVQSFSEDNGGYPRPIMYAAMSAGGANASAAPAPQVPVGQQKVTDNVTITYEIR